MGAFATKVKLIKQAHACEEYAAMNLHDRDLTRAVRKEALAEGMEKGIQKGIQKGIEKGIQEGLNRGMMEKAVEDAVIIVRDFNIEPRIAAQKMNVSIETLLERLGKD